VLISGTNVALRDLGSVVASSSMGAGNGRSHPAASISALPS